MLTSETKQRINTCRDILVGKLPDPKSQVLQITNALIYKFMDDQDRVAETLGGKPSFFVNGLKAYAWHRLFDAKLTNQERADKYIEGLTKLSTADHLPELFREIFKEAYMPFRAANVIALFISEINKFNYSHSEELGNAYEYLLSIMGSQGDAGQFRTPRHIIEFLVDVVDPQKGETIYDPAAGTAGFLIAAYNHILEENDKLSVGDKRKLGTNITGVDISPDMAKMARVNLYLHGFTTPNILEGDTLTDEHLWGHKYDVILANPPFMSPKGGIQPHDKFSIKAKRSEVLFVDYIAEHLKLKGRAGVIVPEGVIFQSGTTYKQLRKMLVEDGYLHTVISLPAGIFQPYSGVKTSMLILDRERAKETDEILFIKVEKDGYSLSTQRTRLCNDNGDKPEWCPNHSDLPIALEVAKVWRKGEKREVPIASWVSKTEIAQSGDFNINAERYRDFECRSSSWPIHKFDEICTLEYGSALPKSQRVDGPYPVMGSNGIAGFHNQHLIDGPAIIVGRKGSAGEVTWVEQDCFPIDTTYYVKLKNTVDTNLRYIYYLLRSLDLGDLKGGAGIPGLNRSDVYQRYRLPIPPIDMQDEIVAELDRYQKIIRGARQVVENYRPQIAIDADWRMVSLSSVCESISDGDHQAPPKASAGIPFVTISNINERRELDFTKTFFVPEAYYSKLHSARTPRGGDILYTVTGSYGIPVLVPESIKFCFQRHIALIRPGRQILDRFLLALLSSPFLLRQAHEAATGVAQKTVSLTALRGFQIPLPPLAAQEAIVAEIEAEEALVNANRQLIELFEAKIKATIDRVWGTATEALPLSDSQESEEEAA